MIKKQGGNVNLEIQLSPDFPQATIAFRPIYDYNEIKYRLTTSNFEVFYENRRKTEHDHAL